MDDVSKSGCKLSWKAPEDDGGKPITGYVVEKMDKASGRWVPVSRTEPNVLECPVKGLQEGHEYMFRVKAVNDEGESEPLESDAPIQAKDPYGETRLAQTQCLHEEQNLLFLKTSFLLNACDQFKVPKQKKSKYDFVTKKGLIAKVH